MNGRPAHGSERHRYRSPSGHTVAPAVYRTYRPRPPLSDVVQLFWSYEGDISLPGRERMLPTGTMQLIVNLEPVSRGSTIPKIPVISSVSVSR